MKFIFTGLNVEIKPALKDYIENKFSKIGKYFHGEPEADITISTQKKMHIFEATIKYEGLFFRAEETVDDLYTGIDKAESIIERQIRKNRTKLEKKLYNGAATFNIEEEAEDIDDTSEFQIKRTKTVSAKPMNAEEAVLQMNLLGHEFFMFTNQDTEKINVVYKRKNGDYGILEPEN